MFYEREISAAPPAIFASGASFHYKPCSVVLPKRIAGNVNKFVTHSQSIFLRSVTEQENDYSGTKLRSFMP